MCVSWSDRPKQGNFATQGPPLGHDTTRDENAAQCLYRHQSWSCHAKRRSIRRNSCSFVCVKHTTYTHWVCVCAFMTLCKAICIHRHGEREDREMRRDLVTIKHTESCFLLTFIARVHWSAIVVVFVLVDVVAVVVTVCTISHTRIYRVCCCPYTHSYS